MSKQNGKSEKLTTGQALDYLEREMEKRPELEAPNWNAPSSGVSWLQNHRNAGHVDYDVIYQGSRPKFLYTREALDDFLESLADLTRTGRPPADFSMLTEEEKHSLTAQEIADKAGVGIKTVYLARMEGRLPKGKPGRPWPSREK